MIVSCCPSTRLVLTGTRTEPRENPQASVERREPDLVDGIVGSEIEAFPQYPSYLLLFHPTYKCIFLFSTGSMSSDSSKSPFWPMSSLVLGSSTAGLW